MDATLTMHRTGPGGFERLWTRLVSFIAAPGDDDEALRKKRLLLVVILAKAPVCRAPAIAFYSLGVPLAALVPVVYQLFDRRQRGSLPRHAQLRAAYQAPIVGVLPEASEMLELGSSGLFTLRSPEHPFTRELRRVASRLE